jgi:hypothetical protein
MWFVVRWPAARFLDDPGATVSCERFLNQPREDNP